MTTLPLTERGVTQVPAAPAVISVLIPATRPVELAACLAALSQSAPAPRHEVLVYDNGISTIANVLALAPHTVTSISGPRLTPSAARNALLPHARGDLLVFLDDDTIPPAGFLGNVARAAASRPDVAVFGGPNVTPAHATRAERRQGLVLESLLGSGLVRRRFRPADAQRCTERDLNLSNLVIRRCVMQPFDATMTSGEENELLDRLTRQGRQLRYQPDLAVEHHRQPDWRSYCQQIRRYGAGRGQVIRRTSLRRQWPYLVGPAAFTATVSATVAAATSAPLAVIPGLYITALIAQGVVVGCRAGITTGAYTTLLTTATHAAYTVGLVEGLAGRRVHHQRARTTP
jgi:GT2 family glycosyltransferase